MLVSGSKWGAKRRGTRTISSSSDEQVDVEDDDDEEALSSPPTPVGRGDARNFSGGYQQQAASNQVGMDDLRRLKGSANRTTSGNISLGPASMLSSRSNSGRRMGPGGFLGPRGEDSATSSRTGTPPTRENTSHSNAFR